MTDRDRRGELNGSAIGAGFGWAWMQWGASGAGSGALALRTFATAVAIVLLVVVGIQRRGAPTDGNGMANAHSFRLVVLVECAALALGGLALNLADQPRYTAAWFAFVVGAHFLALGRLYAPVFTVVAVPMMAAAATATIVGLATGSTDAILVIAGLPSGLSLFAASAWALRRESDVTPPAR